MTFILILNWVYGWLLIETISLCSDLCHLGKWNHWKAPTLTSLVVDTVCWDHTWGCWPQHRQVSPLWNLDFLTILAVPKGEHPERKPSRSCITFYDLPTRSHAGSWLAHSVHWSCTASMERKSIPFDEKWKHMWDWKYFCGRLHLENAMCHMRY